MISIDHNDLMSGMFYSSVFSLNCILFIEQLPVHSRIDFDLMQVGKKTHSSQPLGNGREKDAFFHFFFHFFSFRSFPFPP
jgi:hypothetical protein